MADRHHDPEAPASVERRVAALESTFETRGMQPGDFIDAHGLPGAAGAAAAHAGLAGEKLVEIVTRDAMIGVARP